MSWTQGTDGRRIPLPPNWSWTQGTEIGIVENS